MKITNIYWKQNNFDSNLELLKKTCRIMNREVEQYADSSRYINDKVVGA